jgi:hypothetical protein
VACGCLCPRIILYTKQCNMHTSVWLLNLVAADRPCQLAQRSVSQASSTVTVVQGIHWQ